METKPKNINLIQSNTRAVTCSDLLFQPESLIRVPETQSAFRRPAQRSADRRRDVRQQSILFALQNQSLRRNPKLSTSHYLLSALRTASLQCWTLRRAHSMSDLPRFGEPAAR